MTPFNIDLWKAGRKVITRNKIEPSLLTEFTNWIVGELPDRALCCWDKSGISPAGKNFDLIHPDEEVVVEVHSLGSTEMSYISTSPFKASALPPGKYKLVPYGDNESYRPGTDPAPKG